MSSSFGSEPSVHMVYGKIKFWTIWKKLVYHHRTTQLPLPFRLNNDRNRSGPAEPLGHLWVIWSHLLAQDTLSMCCLEKSSFEDLGRSCPITTDPPTTPLISAKFGFFQMSVRRLWEGPWWFCLIEKWSLMLLLVVWQCQGLTLVDLKQLPFDHRTTIFGIFWRFLPFQWPPRTPPMFWINFYHFIWPFSIRQSCLILVWYMSGVI